MPRLRSSTACRSGRTWAADPLSSTASRHSARVASNPREGTAARAVDADDEEIELKLPSLYAAIIAIEPRIIKVLLGPIFNISFPTLANMNGRRYYVRVVKDSEVSDQKCGYFLPRGGAIDRTSPDV